MCDKIDFVVCRLCLNSGGLLINIFDKNNKSEFMLEKTIEDLINVKVVEDANYPWLVCSACMEKLTEFRLFKHRCAECLFVFYNRIQKSCDPATKDWITNREEDSDVLRHGNKGLKRLGEHMVDGTSDKVWTLSRSVESVAVETGTEMENVYSSDHRVNLMAVDNYDEVEIQFPAEIKEEIDDEAIINDAVDSGALDIQDDTIVVKKEIDTASECSVAPEIDTGSSMVTSMRERDRHWSDNEDSANVGRSEEGDLPLSFNEQVDIKEECDVDNSQEEEGLGGEASQLQDGAKGQDGAGMDTGVSLLRTYLTSNEAFAQEDVPKSNMILVRPAKKPNQFKCGVCPETFGCKRDLDRHFTSAHSSGKKKHQCHHCSRQFTCQSNLRIHMSTHTDARPYECKICAKAFKSKANLDGHMWTHTSDLPLKCEVCSKGFKRKAHLDGHMLTHTGEKPHKCEICAKSFTLKQHLRDHVLFHTGVRPYKCEVCSKGFNLKKHLEAHMSIHNDQRPHKCELCPRAFTRKDNLDGHMLTHSNAKPHECDICSKTFTMRRYLKSHMLTHGAQT